MNIMENYLSIETHSGLMEVFTAAPEIDKKCPVVIVFQEAFGVNNHIKSICRRLAENGYLALAPELFHREGRHIIVEYGDRKAFLPLMGRLSNEGLLEDARSVFDFLPELPSVDTSNVFTLGFCMGGFTSLLCATGLSINGCVSFYGAGVVHERVGIGLRPYLKDFSSIKCPVLLIYGELDVSIPAKEREEIEVSLSSQSKDYEIEVYANSDHGFFCNERKTFNRTAAAFAWKRTLSWLRSHVQQPDKIYTNPVTSTHHP